jgi:hypothetical protein
MVDVIYKQYSDEESSIYDAAVAKIRSGLKNGLSFHEACSAVDVADVELKSHIVDDVLKITLAEMHFGQGVPLPKVAETMKIPAKELSVAIAEMLDDVGITAAEEYRKNNPDMPVGNA